MFSVSQFFRACFIRLGLSAEKLAKVDFGRRLIFTDQFVTQARGATILTFNGYCFKDCKAIISIAIIIGGRRRWAGFLESEVSQSFPCLQTWYLSLWKLPYFSSSSTSDHNSKMIGALLLHIYICAPASNWTITEIGFKCILSGGGGAPSSDQTSTLAKLASLKSRKVSRLAAK